MTEQEKVELQREAFLAGALRAYESFSRSRWEGMDTMKAIAEARYPDPKPAPREVSLGEYTYRVVDGVLERAAENFPAPLRWEPVPALTSVDILTLAELVTHPHIEGK